MVDNCRICESPEICDGRNECIKAAYPLRFDLMKTDSSGIQGDLGGIVKSNAVKAESAIKTLDVPMCMVTLEAVDKNDLAEYIRLAYLGDEKMQNEYHIMAGRPLEELVDYTYRQCIENEEAFRREYYKIVMAIDNGLIKQDIGYSVLVFDEIKILWTFGININFRADNIKTLWLDAVEEVFGRDFYTVNLRTRNERALRFFTEKNRFQYQIQEHDNEKFYVLWRQPS